MRSVQELSSLGGRVALVVGGAGHIGRAAVETLAELGASVVVADLDDEAARAVARTTATAPGADAIALPVDLGDEHATRALPRAVTDRLGRLDVIVHAAAFTGDTSLPGWTTPFEEQSVDTWRSSLEVNLTSTFVLTQAALPALRASGHGSIVLFGSIYGGLGPDLRLYEGTAMNSPAAYAAAKGGIAQLARWLATVLAPDVRVNVCAPGGVVRGQPEEFVQRYIERTPLRRMATEEDLKGAVAYLASDLSAYVTGQTLWVDGGWSSW